MPVIVMQPGVEMGGALLRRVKGTLAVGKPEDVAMIDKDDPLGIDPASLDQIQLVKTIKEGKTVHS